MTESSAQGVVTQPVCMFIKKIPGDMHSTSVNIYQSLVAIVEFF
jgi:hypothetical protein